MKTIDAHIHLLCDHPDCLALMSELDLKFLNVCVVQRADHKWRIDAERYRKLAQAFPDRYAWCTSFDLPDWSADWSERVLAELAQDFANGAVGCKLWKNVGMEVKKPSGEFLMPDDAVFDPIYEYLAQVGKPLLAHLAEPLACWQPLDEHNAHYAYYSQHPEWHMANKPEYPSHQEIMDARDRVLAKHPRLHFVGAHLGSLEYDVAEIAKRLDAYPNFAVDTSARLHDLARQDSQMVREFIIQYQDRILFGTDIVQRDLQWCPADDARRERLAQVRQVYQAGYAYYKSDQVLDMHGRQVQGLALPDQVLEKLYHKNAQAWFPGV